MTTPPRVYRMSFAHVYPLYIAKAEDIIEPTMREIRTLDKLIDELARGK